MMKTIYVLNPSSRTDTGITEELARSLSWLAGPGMPAIECVTLADGPNGISNGVDSDRAAPAVLDFIEAHAADDTAIAFVVACFSDPAVHSARELTAKPVIGIGEAGLALALSLGERPGTIGVSAGQDGKSLRFVRRAGFIDRYAGHRSLGLDYADLQHPERVGEKLTQAALDLRDRDAADIIVFAGAGLARYVDAVRRDTGLPVVDPTLAAVLSALGGVAWGEEGIRR